MFVLELRLYAVEAQPAVVLQLGGEFIRVHQHQHPDYFAEVDLVEFPAHLN